MGHCPLLVYLRFNLNWRYMTSRAGRSCLSSRPKTNFSMDRFKYCLSVCYTGSNIRAGWGLGTRRKAQEILSHVWLSCKITLTEGRHMGGGAWSNSALISPKCIAHLSCIDTALQSIQLDSQAHSPIFLMGLGTMLSIQYDRQCIQKVMRVNGCLVA